MRPAWTAVALIVGITTTSCSTNQDLKPIPGSITYGGQPQGRLTKSPVGSVLPHEFHDKFGYWVQETYVVQADRSLKLVHREITQTPER